MGIYNDLISGKEKLAVVGLGYVGMPLAVEFAKHIKVIGFDVNDKRVNEYKNGIDATNEVGDVIKDTTVEFTSDPSKIKEAKFIIVAVPTPVDDSNKPDMKFLESASKVVGENLSKDSIVVFESTVYPGATEEICLFAIEKYSNLKCGKDWKLGYSPERINPGDGKNTLTNIVKVVSGMDKETGRIIKSVYNIVVKAGTFLVSDIKTAEAVKVVENSQRDINIAFMNEVAMICDKLDIDTNEVLKGMNTKWNALGFKPGLVGGHCIGVDPYYLTDCAQKNGYESKIILNGRKLNDAMGDYIAKKILDKLEQANVKPQDAKVVILGVTFKENCPDIRNSKVFDIINCLQEHGVNPFICDPYADTEAVKEMCNIGLVDFNDLPKANCVVVAVGHDEYRSLSVMQLSDLFDEDLDNSNKILFDVKSLYRLDELKASGLNYWRL